MERLFRELGRINETMQEARVQSVNGLIRIKLQEASQLLQYLQDNINKHTSNLESKGEQPKETRK